MSDLKRAVAIVAIIGLVSSGIAMAEPLTAGKPAGVRKAQLESVPALVWIGLAAIAAGGIAGAAATGNSPSTFTTAPASTGTTS